MAAQEINFPIIATAKEVAELMRMSPKTVQNYASMKRWMPGIYIGFGRYNIDKLKKHIENGKWLRRWHEQ